MSALIPVNAALPHPGEVSNNTSALKRAYPAFLSFDSIQTTKYNGSGKTLGTGDFAANGRESEARVQWNFTFIPFKENTWTDEIIDRSLVFIHRIDKGTISDRQRVVGLGLPQLNFYLHDVMLENAKKNPPTPPTPPVITPTMTPNNVVDSWFLAGVSINFTPMSGNKMKERSFVLETKGDLAMINYWGEYCRGMNHLWLVIKMIPVTGDICYILNKEGTSYRQLKYNQNVPFVPCIVPEHTEHKYLPRHQLYYTMNDVECRGIPIYVGRCIRNRTAINTPKDFVPNNMLLCRDMRKLAATKHMDVQVSIL